MNGLLTLVVGGLFSFLTGVQNLPNQHLNAELEYDCQKLVWTEPGELIKNDKFFTGAIEVSCTFKALAGVGYVGLKDALIKALEEEAVEIHSGPEEVIYAEMPGVHYEATVDMESEEEEKMRVRGDVYIATNEVDRLVQEILSKKVSGEGLAANIEKVDAGYEVTNTDEEMIYHIRIASYSKVKRPWWAPASMFLDTCTGVSPIALAQSL